MADQVKRNTKGQFAKGGKGVSPGRPKLPEDLRRARQMSLEDRIKFLAYFLGLTRAEISKIDKSKLTIAEWGILRAYRDNDTMQIQYHENRLWGKPTEVIDLEGSVSIENKYKSMSEDELIQALGK
jgi:hypothetical protein